MILKAVTVFVLLASLTAAELCTERNCTCTTVNTQTNIDCVDKGLTTIGNLSSVPKNVLSLDLSKNRITSIPELEYIDGLKTLKLGHNEIREIAPNAFNNFFYLEHLDLCHNHISNLSLEGLNGLRTLDISHNILRSLPDNIFFFMSELIELRLNGNPLHYLRYEWFRTMSKVTVLDLSECALTSLPTNAFHDMLNLVELDLSRNLFDVVPTDELRSASNLKKLKMSGNQLEVIKKASFKRCPVLEDLELNDMGTLTEIQHGAFSGLKLLKTLKISHNPNLKKLDFGVFEGLYNTMDKHWEIEELILRDNGLTVIKSPSLTLCNIKTLDLQGNPWNCDCNLAWMPGCEPPQQLSNDLKCASPPQKEGKLIRDIDIQDMTCGPDMLEEHHQRALRIVVVTSGLVGIVFCAIVIVIVIKKRKIMEWWYYRKRGSGAVYYVKAKTNPQDASRGGI